MPAQSEAVFRRTCENWALCIWFMTTEDDHVPYKFVVNAIRNLLTEGALGALLTGAMVLLFLRDWRSSLIVIVTIPFALLFAVAASQE